MKLTAFRDDLLQPLRQAKALASTHNTLPILSCCLLQAEGDRLQIRATNLEIELIIFTPAIAIQEPGNCCLPAGKLSAIFDTLPPGSQVAIETSPGFCLIHAGKSRFKVPRRDSEDFPESAITQGVLSHFSLPAGILADAIHRTAYACGVDGDTRSPLIGVLWELGTDNGLLTMVATDGHRLARVAHFIGEPLPREEGKEPRDLQVILPAKALSRLLALIGKEEAGTVEVRLQENAAIFSAPLWTLSARAIEGPFPEYAYVIPQQFDRLILADREAFSQAVRRASILSDGSKLSCGDGVLLGIKEGEMVVDSISTEHGDASDTLSCELEGEELSLGFGSRYLLDALGAVASPRVRLELTGSTEAVLIRGEEVEPGINVIMPLRLN